MKCLVNPITPIRQKGLISVIVTMNRASQVVLVVNNPSINAGNIRILVSILGSGKSLKGEHGNPLQCSCLENPRDGGAWNSPGQNSGMGSLSLLQGIFPTQGSNPGLPHFRQILYQLSHKGNPRILEWVAYPISSGSSRPRNQTGVSCITGGFFTN